MRVDNGIINFAVYEDATEYLGMAEVTLPEITQITEEIKGAGIAGGFNAAYIGQIEAMSLSLAFRTFTKASIRLAEPRSHQLDLRAAQQFKDNATGRVKTESVKHILVVTPTKIAPGKLAVAASAESSQEFSVTYFATYIEGEKVTEIDPINFIYFINGVDYLKDVRKALGK